MSVPWIIAGSTATAGVFWVVQGTFVRAALLGGVPMVAIAAILGGLASGSLIASHAPVRPSREPLLAGVIGMALVVAAVLALANSTTYAPHYVPSLWLQVALVVAGGASGVAGAHVLRRLKSVSVSTMSVILLSSAVHFGVLVMMISIVDLAGVGEGGTMVTAFGGVVVASFLTQLAVPVRKPWACASGVLLFPVFSYMNDQSAKELVAVFVGMGVLILIGRLGSGFANRMAARPEADDLPPSARASDS